MKTLFFSHSLARSVWLARERNGVTTEGDASLSLSSLDEHLLMFSLSNHRGNSEVQLNSVSCAAVCLPVQTLGKAAGRRCDFGIKNSIQLFKICLKLPMGLT